MSSLFQLRSRSLRAFASAFASVPSPLVRPPHRAHLVRLPPLARVDQPSPLRLRVESRHRASPALRPRRRPRVAHLPERVAHLQSPADDAREPARADGDERDEGHAVGEEPRAAARHRRARECGRRHTSTRGRTDRHVRRERRRRTTRRERVRATRRAHDENRARRRGRTGARDDARAREGRSRTEGGTARSETTRAGTRARRAGTRETRATEATRRARRLTRTAARGTRVGERRRTFTRSTCTTSARRRTESWSSASPRRRSC